MSLAFWIVIGIFGLFDLWLFWELIHAPEGWEDERGFHYGRKP